MSAPKLPLVFIAGLAAAAVALLGWQRHTADQLRSEIVRQQVFIKEERSRLEDEQRRLKAARVPEAELQKRRAERTAVSSLLGEIESMRRRADESARAIAARNRPPSAEAVIEPSLTKGPVPARFWKKAGQATPEAAFETALWAGAGGNVKSLTGLIVFDADARAKAQAIFTGLPPAIQQELGTPEQLIALLVAKDVPLGSAEILTRTTPDDPLADTKLTAKLVAADGKSKQVQLSLRARDGSWRFVVPPNAVEKYAAELRVPAAGSP